MGKGRPHVRKWGETREESRLVDTRPEEMSCLAFGRQNWREIRLWSLHMQKSAMEKKGMNCSYCLLGQDQRNAMRLLWVGARQLGLDFLFRKMWSTVCGDATGGCETQVGHIWFRQYCLCLGTKGWSWWPGESWTPSGHNQGTHFATGFPSYLGQNSLDIPHCSWGWGTASCSRTHQLLCFSHFFLLCFTYLHQLLVFPVFSCLSVVSCFFTPPFSTASDFSPPLPTVLPAASNNQPPNHLLLSYLLSSYTKTQDAPPLHRLKSHLATTTWKRDSPQVPTCLRLSACGATVEKALLSGEGSLRQQCRLSCMPEPVKALRRAGAGVMETEPWENLTAKLS